MEESSLKIFFIFFYFQHIFFAASCAVDNNNNNTPQWVSVDVASSFHEELVGSVAFPPPPHFLKTPKALGHYFLYFFLEKEECFSTNAFFCLYTKIYINYMGVFFFVIYYNKSQVSYLFLKTEHHNFMQNYCLEYQV